MSGYNFMYKVKNNYFVDIHEFYEEANINRVFIYKKNFLKKDLVEIMDFELGIEKTEMLEKAKVFILELEELTKEIKKSSKKNEKSVDETL